MTGNFLKILLPTVSVAIAALGVLVLIHAHKKRANQLFSLFSLVTAIWVAANSLALFFPESGLVNLSYSVGVFVPITGFYWIIEFTRKHINLGILLVVQALGVLIAVLPFIPGLFFQQVTSVTEYGIRATSGVGYYIFSAFIAGIIIWQLIILGLSLRNVGRQDWSQRLFVFLGLIFFAGTSTLVSVILPLFDVTRFATLDSPSVLIFIVLAAYAMIKHQLFNLKVVFTEVMALTSVLFFFTQIFLSTNKRDLIFRIVIFVFSSAAGVFLIRSVIEEVKKREEVERLNRQLGDFLRFGTHELRSPLGGIRGYTSLILDGSFGACSPQLVTTVKKIQSEVDHLLLVVETFLDANRARSGNMEVVIEPTDAKEAVEKATQTLTASFELKNLKLVTHYDDSLPAIHADPRKIQIILGNLLSNSLKYTEKGSIDVSTKKQNGKVVIQVKDTGIGIPKKVLPHLYTQFERGSDRAKKMATGSGIGLYLTKKLVEAMQGLIEITSAGPGKGTTATLTFLPYK